MSSFVPIKQVLIPMNSPSPGLRKPSTTVLSNQVIKDSDIVSEKVITTPTSQHRVPFSPLSAKPQNPNVVRLLSMKKTNRYLSDADILSVAVDSSIRKTKEKAIRQIQDENLNISNIENSADPILSQKSTISKRLFDINQCSSQPNPASMDSPEQTSSLDKDQQHQHDQSVAKSKQVSMTLEENIFNNISTTIQEEVQKELDDQHRIDALQNLMTSYTESIDKHSKQRQNNINNSILTLAIPSDHHQITTGGDENDLSSSITETHGIITYPSKIVMSYDEITSATPSTSSSPIGIAENRDIESEVVENVISLSNLKSLVVSHILNILNKGSYEELLTLHGIGQVRALRILTHRNSISAITPSNDTSEITSQPPQQVTKCFQTIEDLHLIGMNEKTILKFLKANAAEIVS